MMSHWLKGYVRLNCFRFFIVIFLLVFIAAGCSDDDDPAADPGTQTPAGIDNSNFYGIYNGIWKIGNCPEETFTVQVGNDHTRATDDGYVFIPEFTDQISFTQNSEQFDITVSGNTVTVKTQDEGRHNEVIIDYAEGHASATLSGSLSGDDPEECIGDISGSLTRLDDSWEKLSKTGYESKNNKNLLPVAFYQGELYATAGVSSSEDEGIAGTPVEVWKYSGAVWTQVNTDGFGDPNNIYGDSVGAAVYDDKLYVGAENKTTGLEVWELDGSTRTWMQVNTDGFEDPANNKQCQTMAVYNNRLYAATGFGYDDGIKVWAYDGTSWANTNLDDGKSNEKIDAMIAYNSRLFITTYNEGDGCEVWSYDGSDWRRDQDNGFGDTGNIVGSSMTIFNNALIIGTGNMNTGGEVWQYDGASFTQINTDGFGDADNLLAWCVGQLSSSLYVSASTFSETKSGQL